MTDDLTIDDLTMIGIDGIRRSFDEHYYTMMDVREDPTGAHYAIQKQHARIKGLEAKLAKAVAAEENAIDTLNAWFDRRKLAHDAVDQAVIDAASEYLRTSRVGGMPHEESDLVLGVIEDMAQMSVFADLFARTALAELKGNDT